MKSRYSFGTILTAIVMAILATATYWSIQTYRGFPSYDQFGDNKYLLWGEIDPPTREGYPGRIYLWMYDPDRPTTTVENILKENYTKVPRAFSIPYTEENARELREAIEQLRNGSGVVVQILPNPQLKNSGSDQDAPRLKMQALDPYKILKKPVDNR